MKKSQYTVEQIVKIVRESHERGVQQTARKYKVSENTLYIWRRKYGGLFDSATMCRHWAGQIYIVELRRADGTLVCSKPVTMPLCYHEEPAQ